jgi:hypothetical protein
MGSGWRSVGWFLAAGLVASAVAQGGEFYQDFRGRAGVPPVLTLFGGDPAKAMKTDAEGLRLTISGGEGPVQMKTLDTGVRQGRLRVTRQGSELVFAAAAGDSPEFQEVHRTDARPDPLTALRVCANSGGSPTPVSVRLVDLRIRADSLSGAAGRRAADRGSGWLVLLLVLVIGAGAAAVVWRQGWWNRWLGAVGFGRKPESE